MYRNCSSRPGHWELPRRFRLARREKPSFRSRRCTVQCPTRWPFFLSLSLSLRVLLRTHVCSLTGLPAISSATSPSKSLRRVGSLSSQNLGPRLAGEVRRGRWQPRSSRSPAEMRAQLSPVASATRRMPPRPMAAASAAAHSRQRFPFRWGLRTLYLVRISSGVLISGPLTGNGLFSPGRRLPPTPFRYSSEGAAACNPAPSLHGGAGEAPSFGYAPCHRGPAQLSPRQPTPSPGPRPLALDG